MKNLRLSTKLTAAFLVVALTTLVVGFAGWNGVNQVDEMMDEIGKNYLQSIHALGYMNEAMLAIQLHEKNLVHESDGEIVRQQYAGMEQAWKKAEQGRKIYDPLRKDPEEEKRWKAFGAAWDGWKKQHIQVLDLIKKGDDASRKAAYALSYGAAGNAFAACEKLLEDMTDDNVKEAEEAIKVGDAAVGRAKTVSLAGMIIGSFLALLLGIIVTRGITKPLTRVITGLTDGADQVAAAAQQVSSSSQQLAEGTSEQASSLEETSSSLEEMSSMTKQNADHATQAKAMMAEANQVVEKVNRHMTDMTAAVGEITRSSEETGKIIKTIDEIAFQTNLLALNAAVEAARAGEAGAGFAVVADEVRNLAMRAAEAAKNTSSLIENTIKAVHSGRQLTESTQEAFKENADISRKVGQLVDEIAQASEEQSRGISQVNVAVGEMDKVTQSTAANAEESAAAAEEMNAQADQMKVYVQDLVSVVNGSDNGRISLSSGPVVGPVGGLRRLPVVANKAPSLLEKKHELQAAGKAFKKVVRPEEVIPLEDGGFKDF